MIRNYLENFFADESGQGMVEYGLIIGLIAVVLVVAITALSGGISNIFTSATTKLNSASGTTTSGS